MSLRRASLVFAAVLTFVGVGVAITLLVLTTNLHRAAHEIGGGVESVRIGEELEFGLVSLRDAREPLARETSETLVRQQLADAAAYVGDPDEEAALARMRRLTEAYIAMVHATPADRDAARAAFEAAFASVREWIQLNVEQSRAIKPIVARWDRVANLVGISAMLLLVVGLGALAWWVQQRTFRPALKLVGAIERYARGEHEVRASEQGPEEFRVIAHRFNDMASTLERQRAGQLAFLAGVAHDLRNPLTALKMATGMITSDQPLPSEARMRQLFVRVGRQIDRLERMVYDFLDAARIEAGKLELQLEASDLRDLVRATVDLFEPATRTHELVAELPGDPVRLTCDPMRIEQVLANLVSNAIKYSPQGGRVRVVVSADPEAVRVAVSDDGIGISADELQHVFEPFRRTGTSTESIPGVGLGLFVARKLVNAHGGDLTVESTLGTGSTFIVRLPTRRDPAANG